jgi:hypothetical protein
MRDILDRINQLNENRGLTAIGTADVDVDPEVSAAIAARALDMAAEGKNLSNIEREALKGYVDLFKELISNPSFRSRLKDMKRILDKQKDSDDSKEDK